MFSAKIRNLSRLYQKKKESAPASHEAKSEALSASWPSHQSRFFHHLLTVCTQSMVFSIATRRFTLKMAKAKIVDALLC